jgi:hypothetical protein
VEQKLLKQQQLIQQHLHLQQLIARVKNTHGEQPDPTPLPCDYPWFAGADAKVPSSTPQIQPQDVETLQALMQSTAPSQQPLQTIPVRTLLESLLKQQRQLPEDTAVAQQDLWQQGTSTASALEQQAQLHQQRQQLQAQLALHQQLQHELQQHMNLQQEHQQLQEQLKAYQVQVQLHQQQLQVSFFSLAFLACAELLFLAAAAVRDADYYSAQDPDSDHCPAAFCEHAPSCHKHPQWQSRYPSSQAAASPAAPTRTPSTAAACAAATE